MKKFIKFLINIVALLTILGILPSILNGLALQIFNL